MAALPPLVITGNRIDALGPVQLLGVIMRSFCVAADRTKVQALLDKTFATPSGGAVAYEAIGDKVFVSFAEISKLYAVDAVEKDHGVSSEIDVTIWVMVRRLHRGLIALRWFPAYLFVDNGPAMASGREVWGFPKQLGRFDFSPATSKRATARSFQVDGFVLSPFAATSETRWVPMIEARPLRGSKDSSEGGALETLEAFAEKALARLTDGFASIAGKLQTALGSGAMTMAFLKQFPDAANPMTACYQGIIEAEARITTLRGAGLTDDSYQLRITSFDSQPFFAELGIAPDWQEVGQGVWIDFDFELDLGAEVWRGG
jgi:Acetoacetate decarboxylase (ADC)